MAGSITVTHTTLGNVRQVVCRCIADASSGEFPTQLLPKFEGRLWSLVTVPGAEPSASASASASTSPSLSPSVSASASTSASASASPTPSASSSISPSVSASSSSSPSRSPSPSLSPSRSASASASPSLSPSASSSPSSSISPSASASPSLAAPSANYDVRLMRHGVDVLFGAGANRSRTAAEEVPIVYPSTEIHPLVDEADELTLVIDNHFEPSAEVEVRIIYALGA